MWSITLNASVWTCSTRDVAQIKWLSVIFFSDLIWSEIAKRNDNIAAAAGLDSLPTVCKTSRLSADVVKETIAVSRPIKTVGDHATTRRADHRSVRSIFQQNAHVIVDVVDRRIQRFQRVDFLYTKIRNCIRNFLSRTTPLIIFGNKRNESDYMYSSYKCRIHNIVRVEARKIT